MLNFKYAEQSSIMRICVVFTQISTFRVNPLLPFQAKIVVHFSILKMKAVYYSDIVAPVYKFTLRHFPKGSTFNYLKTVFLALIL